MALWYFSFCSWILLKHTWVNLHILLSLRQIIQSVPKNFFICVFWLALIIFISCRKCRELTNISKKNYSRVLYLKVSFYIHMVFSFIPVFVSPFIHVTIVSWHALFTYLYFFAGSNLLLQRIMVKRGVPEDMTFVAFDSTTSLCTSSYVRICITLSFCIVVFLFREKKFSILLLLPHRKCLASQRGELVCNKFMR